MTTVDLPLLPLGRGVDLASERGVECPGDLPSPSDPDHPVEIGHVSPANHWAVDVAMAARLEVWSRGFLALRQMKEPVPYLPHPTLL